MSTGSHHGDPSLSHQELDTCLEVVKWIQEGMPKWLPSSEGLDLYLDAKSKSEQEIKTVHNMVRWIEITRRERYAMYKQEDQLTWLPHNIDMLKSRLFWRLRSGKDPLPYPPPTAFSCPWYELIEDDRAHWAYDCYIHKPGEQGLWGRHTGPIANIGQCLYNVETWSDKEETIPFSVSYGPYLFRTYLGPFETHQYNPQDKSIKVITLQGWWIKHVKNPLAPGAFDLTTNELPYKIGQSRD